MRIAGTEDLSQQRRAKIYFGRVWVKRRLRHLGINKVYDAKAKHKVRATTDQLILLKGQLSPLQDFKTLIQVLKLDLVALLE